ncbi:MAG: 3'(2'),5'-bisphosphate nucleotidase CysQ [Bacteroidota bacterium]
MNPGNVLLTLNAAIQAGNAILEVYKSSFTVEHKEDKSPLTQADKNANAIIVQMLSGTRIPILSEEGKIISFEERKTWRELWVVDPLDGTKEFIKRNGEFTVNIALVENGVSVFGVIYQPVDDILFYGEEGKGAFKITAASTITPEELTGKSVLLGNEALPKAFTIVASRSHLSPETSAYIEKARLEHKDVECISSGSSLKLCMIAERKAHVYPRFAPTMEWDTAAGHAILKGAGKNVYSASTGEEIHYNKPDLRNDWFIAK